MKYTKEQLTRFVSELKESDLELSKWEESFLDSVGGKLSKGWTLSDRQIEILERLYAEKTPL